MITETQPRPWEIKPDFSKPESALSEIAKYKLFFTQISLRPGIAHADKDRLFGTTDDNYEKSKLRPPLAGGLSFELQIMAKTFPLEKEDRDRLLDCAHNIEKVGTERAEIVNLKVEQEQVDRLLIRYGEEQETVVNKAVETALEVLAKLESKYKQS